MPSKVAHNGLAHSGQHVMGLTRLFAVLALGLFLFAIPEAVLAQCDERYDVILIKEIVRGDEDALFVGRMEDKVERWVSTVGRVFVRYEQQLESDRQKRANFLKSCGNLTLKTKFVKNGDAAAVIFRIAQTDAVLEARLPTLDEFRYSVPLEPSLNKAENRLDVVLRSIVTPMLRIYMQATHGAQLLADCIRPEVHDTETKRVSKQITLLYPNSIRAQPTAQSIGVHGLNSDQVRVICLKREDDHAAGRFSDEPSVRVFFDHVVYGDLLTGSERVYLTWMRRRSGTEEHHTIEVPNAKAEDKAAELATQIFQLISKP